MRTYQENWRAPLAELSLEVRSAIGNVVIYLYQSWDSFEWKRYIPDCDKLYLQTNHITRTSRETKNYFISIVENIFNRLNLPIPSSNRLETGPM